MPFQNLICKSRTEKKFITSLSLEISQETQWKVETTSIIIIIIKKLKTQNAENPKTKQKGEQTSAKQNPDTQKRKGCPKSKQNHQKKKKKEKSKPKTQK